MRHAMFTRPLAAALLTVAAAVPLRAAEEKHSHPTAGPHKGALIELGDEEYHAEVVHDEAAHTVTIYLLDAEAKRGVAIGAKDVVINVKHAGKGEQYKLLATPQAGDPAGTASKFAVANETLCQRLDGHADARLRVTIGGKAYTGKVEHAHDHDHDHEPKAAKKK